MSVIANCESKFERVPPVFDASKQQYQSDIPKHFIWPDEEKPSLNAPELKIPTLDLGGFLSGDHAAQAEASRLINEACQKHGFFLIVNHGVDQNLIKDTHQLSERFFKLPLSEKEEGKRKFGESVGYASSFTNRFSGNLPWKETLSFECLAEKSASPVHDYIVNTYHGDFEKMGKVIQDYADAMNKLSLEIMELIGTSLGLDRTYFKDFFEDNDSILRLNYYPKCQQPGLVLGTGPHTDPISLAILHQDQVDGLQVLVDNVWQYVRPGSNSFVVNIGDTFTALTNGKYKSVMHRAVVNSEAPRKSFAYFLCPNKDKIIRPPLKLLSTDMSRLYPDFTWREYLEFTQKQYRVDLNTLDSFIKWIGKNNKN